MLPSPRLEIPNLKWIFCILFLCGGDKVNLLIILNMDLPAYVRVGEEVSMTCVYDLEDDQLYSVQWYKDGKEFYSFIPELGKENAKRVFKVDGLSINETLCDDRKIILRNVSFSSEGEFKCQVSGESLRFTTQHISRTLRVADVPDTSPAIQGVPIKIDIGSWLNLNCSTPRSRPPIYLTWFINDKEASENMHRRYEGDLKNSTNGYQASVLGLQFWVNPWHYEGAKLTVHCVGFINDVYSKQSETFVVGWLNASHKVMEATSAGLQCQLLSRKAICIWQEERMEMRRQATLPDDSIS